MTDHMRIFLNSIHYRGLHGMGFRSVYGVLWFAGWGIGFGIAVRFIDSGRFRVFGLVSWAGGQGLTA